MNSFDILSKTTPLHSRLFLEASAGTGKTFTIEHLVVRLLLETCFNLNEIVIVTFTRAATRELKNRIRENLEKVVTSPDAFPYLEGISDVQKNKLMSTLASFDAAQIFTIHGFCAQLLSQFAYEAGLPPHLTEWTREEELWELKQFLRTQTVLSAGQIKRLFSSYRFDLQRLAEAMLRSSNPESTKPAQIPSLKNIHPFSLIQQFEDVRSSYKGMTAEEFSHQAVQLENALKEGEIRQEVWDSWIADPPFFLKNLSPSQLKVRAKKECSSQITALRELILPPLEDAQNVNSIFKILSSAWHVHRKIISEKKGKVGPDDLLRLVHSKLSSTSFIEAIRKKYHVAIVDEFQDTDPLQWQIFKSIFIDDLEKQVYLVGDPKQSIYAFRKADIYTFLDAAAEFGVQQKAALVRNFRSTSGLIEAMNKLLCQSSWIDLPKTNQFLPVSEVIAAQEGVGHLCFMIAEGEKGRGTRFPTQEMEETQFFPFIAEKILTLDPTSCAILVKDRYQAYRMRKFLEKWNIPTSVTRNTSLSQSDAIEYLEEVIDATLDTSSANIRKMLLGPFAAIPYHLLSSDDVYSAKNHLETLREIWIQNGFATFFAQFLNTTFGEQNGLLTFNAQTDLYDDLLEITQKILLAHTPGHVKELLTEIKIFDTEDRTPPHSHGVQIMTTHASKGLEFETVFALGLASRSPSQELSNEHLRELDAEKMRQFYVAVTRAVKELYIPIAREIPEPSYELGEGSPVELFFSKASPDLTQFSQEFLPNRTFQLRPLKPLEPALLVPPPRLQNRFPERFIQSFSSLAKDSASTAKGDDEGIDAGRETGVIIHRILERYFNQEGTLQQVTLQEIRGTRLEKSKEKISTLLTKTLALSLGKFCLNDISMETVQTEMEFLYNTPQGWMKGYIDLCFEHEGKLYVVDWKTNLLENTDPTTIESIMESHDYHLQAKIYTEAMNKYSRMPFGGVYFIFIRGPVYFYV